MDFLHAAVDNVRQLFTDWYRQAHACTVHVTISLHCPAEATSPGLTDAVHVMFLRPWHAYADYILLKLPPYSSASHESAEERFTKDTCPSPACTSLHHLCMLSLPATHARASHAAVRAQTLTAAQEAYLDTQSQPWYPDIWQLSHILEDTERTADQARRPSISSDGAAQLREESAASSQLLSQLSAFQMLITPITASGIGLRFKRECLRACQHMRAAWLSSYVASHC